MNQLCKVCGEPAAGFHFGAFTCEGCKSFFGRTYNNIGSISECKNNGKCVINKKNRTACKACRLRKCMMVGMSKSGSRYGRRSNWFKIHCLLQQQQQHADNSLAAAANLLRPNPYLSPLFRGSPSVVNTSLPVRENSGRSSESDSGASSADPEDDLRSASALSYPSLRHLPSPSSDTECFARRKQLGAFTNNNCHISGVPPGSISPASLPCISPSGLVPNINNNNTRWSMNNSATSFSLQGLVSAAAVSPFAGLGLTDPAVWRELWLRQNNLPADIPAAATTAPDQEQPIDLSLRQSSEAAGLKGGSSEDQALKELSNGLEDNDLDTIDVGVDESVSKCVPLDLTLER